MKLTTSGSTKRTHEASTDCDQPDGITAWLKSMLFMMTTLNGLSSKNFSLARYVFCVQTLAFDQAPAENAFQRMSNRTSAKLKRLQLERASRLRLTEADIKALGNDTQLSVNGLIQRNRKTFWELTGVQFDEVNSVRNALLQVEQTGDYSVDQIIYLVRRALRKGS